MVADRADERAADLVGRRVAVIVTSSTSATLAAKAATATIPIVFGTGGDPVALGLVASLNRPGGNLTGIATLANELAPKQLQLLRELLPNAALLGVLADPGRRVQIATLAARSRIPAAYGPREFVEVGGLMSYGTNSADRWRRRRSEQILAIQQP